MGGGQSLAIRLEVQARHSPEIDPGFLPAVLWNRAFASAVRASRGGVPLGIALVRQDGTVFRHAARILPTSAANAALNLRYVERLVKFLLWQKGGATVLVKGADAVARALAQRLFRQGRPRLRPGFPGPSRLRRADRGQGGEAAAARARDAAPARAPPRRLPDRLRPRRQRPQGGGARRRQGRLLGRGEVGSLLREGPRVPPRGRQRHDPARRRSTCRGSTRSAAARPASTSTASRAWARSTAASRSPISTATSAACSARCSSGGAACRSRW